MDLLTRHRWSSAVGAAILGLAVGLAAARHRLPPGPAAALGGVTGRVSVVAVLQPGDCDSRLDALAPVLRLADSSGLPVAIRVPGRPADVARVTQALAAHGWPLVATPATPAAVRAVRALGFTETPLLAIIDAAGRVAFAAPLPETPNALVRWHAILPLVVRG